MTERGGKRCAEAMWIVMLVLLSGCSVFDGTRPTQTPIYITATPAPTETPVLADTAVLGPTIGATLTWTPLPSATKTPVPTDVPTLTPSFTPEFTDTPTPKVKATTAIARVPVSGNGGGTCVTALQPNGFTTIYQRDQSVRTALGCPLSQPIAIGSAIEAFENGLMLWAASLADQPHKVIYTVFNSGSYGRFDDTWTEGVDQSNTGENPPADRRAPVRGFGKVWHFNPTVRSGLGWALNDEVGISAEIQRFERGEMLYVSSSNQTYIFANGTWRVDQTRF